MEEETSKDNSGQEANEGGSVIDNPSLEGKTVKNVHPQPAGNSEDKEFDPRREISKSEKIGHWLTAIEIIIVVVTGLAFYGEYIEIRNQTILMENQISATAVQGKYSDAITDQQMKLLQQQVDAIKVQMREDQRPWIHVMWDAQVSVSLDNPPKATLTAKNIGKSPARNVLGMFRIEVVKNGETIKFMNPDWNGNVKEVVRRNLPATFFSAGLMFLNDPPTVISVSRTKKDKTWQEEFPLARVEAKQITSADSFVVIHGIITYFDAFEVAHWTKFCAWGSGANGSHDFTAKACADYNEVDSNH